METLKILLDIGKVPLGSLTIYDALQSAFRTIKLNRDPECRLCGDHPTITSVSNRETFSNTSCQSGANTTMPSITTTELRELLSNNYQGLLIDVREPNEHEMASIPEARLIPLATLPRHLDELPRDRDIHIHCKSGMRSGRAVEFLAEHGFTRVFNVTGGIDAWLAEE